MNMEKLEAPVPDGAPHGVWSMNTERQPNGELCVAGVPVGQIAQEFSTPRYVLDADDARFRARAWKEAMDHAFAGLAGAHVYYAGKAFLSKAFARWMYEEGLHIDTASEGELRTALAGGVPGSACGLHGNNKSRAEIELALREHVAHIVVDSLAELDFVNTIAQENGLIAPIYLRLTTGVHAGGHEFISTAHEDQKFGLSVSTGVAREAMIRAGELEHVELIGLHSHIGSQISATEGFAQAAQVIFDERVWAYEQGLTIKEIDLGGGYGIRYTAADDIAPSPREFARILAHVVREHVEKTGLPAPLVSIEPGRSIVAPSMLTLYTVGTVKDVAIDSGVRTYVSVDGGMSDNIRPALYEADYTAALANRSSAAPVQRARVVGKHCESGDIVVRNVALPSDITAGDLLAVPATGAYGRAMASNYNMLPRPGVVAVTDGVLTELIRSESIEDLLALDQDQ
ncbi:diaminopimelate decarboxylase [Arcanobacterium pluranimalium]|uniref:diaminopimelate decarboxylase n=1 Tax=Arcanobacterium pluranimalium TaxID=108028 RepID=UPI00195C2707|nr:diaminopimelate decarboxylase [Arcanobacterium pluranimalium]MBM7825849.1 diaminopimelate decarboxylase [Arcanobacterium pluranimalium]